MNQGMYVAFAEENSGGAERWSDWMSGVPKCRWTTVNISSNELRPHTDQE